MLDEKKAILASDMLANPGDLRVIGQRYILVKDRAPMGNYDKFVQAINLAADYGWDILQIVYDSTGSQMFALLENAHYKRKNQPE